MGFLLTDIGATIAALLGYLAFVALERHRAQAVTLARTTGRPGAGTVRIRRTDQAARAELRQIIRLQ